MPQPLVLIRKSHCNDEIVVVGTYNSFIILLFILDVNMNFAVSFSDISGKWKLQRDRAHSTIRTKSAKCGQSASGQRGSRGENHS